MSRKVDLSATSLWIGPHESSDHSRCALLNVRPSASEGQRMMSRNLIRRLERLEFRLGIQRKRYFRVEYYDRSSDGSLIRRPESDDDRTEAERTIRVVYVSAAGTTD